MTHIAKETIFNSVQSIFSATDFLNQHYQYISDLFSDYEHINSIAEKKKISKMICESLLANMWSEEVIFFPEIKKSLKEKGPLSAIIMVHSILKYLIAEIESLDADSVIYDIKIKVLGDHVRQLIKDKQSKLFAKVIASGKIDLWRLGAELAAYKAA